MSRRNFRGRGGINNLSKRSDLKCKSCGKNGHEVDHYWDSWDSIKVRHNHNKKDKNKNQEIGKAPNYAHYIVAHCNLGIIDI